MIHTLEVLQYLVNNKHKQASSELKLMPRMTLKTKRMKRKSRTLCLQKFKDPQSLRTNIIIIPML